MLLMPLSMHAELQPKPGDPNLRRLRSLPLSLSRSHTLRWHRCARNQTVYPHSGVQEVMEGS